MNASKTIVSDVDGILTDGKFAYTTTGKILKMFGAHDSDGIKLLKSIGYDIKFITADHRGYPISVKRLEHLGCTLELVEDGKRLEYIKENYGKDIIYLGDGYYDAAILEYVDVGVTLLNGLPICKSNADVVLQTTGGNGAFMYLYDYLTSKAHTNIKRVISEINKCVGHFDTINGHTLPHFLEVIERAHNIFLIGAGRMGYACRGFAMRLSHLGYKSFFISDSNTPRVTPNDLVIFGTSSGNTPSIRMMLDIAVSAEAMTACITANSNGYVSRHAGITLYMGEIQTGQFMKTVYEQSIQVVFDYIASLLIEERGLDTGILGLNHSIFE